MVSSVPAGTRRDNQAIKPETSLEGCGQNSSLRVPCLSFLVAQEINKMRSENGREKLMPVKCKLDIANAKMSIY